MPEAGKDRSSPPPLAAATVPPPPATGGRPGDERGAGVLTPPTTPPPPTPPQPRQAGQAGPPPVAGPALLPPRTDQRSYSPERLLLEAFGKGAQESFADLLLTAANISGVLAHAAHKLSLRTAEPVQKAFTKVRDYLKSAANHLYEDAAKAEFTDPSYVAGRIAQVSGYLAGRVIPSLATYGTAASITKAPAASMALIDAFRELDDLTWQSAIAALTVGARSYLGGKAIEHISYIPSFGKRFFYGSLIGGANALAEKLSPEEALALMLTTGGLSALAVGKRPEVVREIERKASIRPPIREVTEILAPPSELEEAIAKGPLQFTEEVGLGVKVLRPVPKITSVSVALRSPSELFKQHEPVKKLVEAAIAAENSFVRDTLNTFAELDEIYSRLPRSLEESVHRALDNPAYSLDRLPPLEPAAVEAYKRLRTILENYRITIGSLLEKYGILPEYARFAEEWGIKEGYWPRKILNGDWVVFVNDRLAPGRARYTTRLGAIIAAKKIKLQDPSARVTIVQLRPPEVNVAGKMSWTHIMQRRIRETLEEAGVKPVSEDVRRILEQYSYDRAVLYRYVAEANRFLRLFPLSIQVPRVRSHLQSVYGEDAPEVRAFEAWWRAVRGDPGRLANAISSFASSIGIPPSLVPRFASFAMNAEAVAKLSTLGSALANLGQIVHTLIPSLGPKYTALGLKGYLSGKFDWLIDVLGIQSHSAKYDKVFPQFIAAAFRLRPVRTIGDVAYDALYGISSIARGASMALLYPFNKAEVTQRATAAIGAYLRAIDEGMNAEEALRMANRMVKRTMFHYGTADAPAIVRGIWNRLIFQFSTFMIKMLEFMFGMFSKTTTPRFDTRKKEVARFIGWSLPLAGVLSIPGLAILDHIVKMITGKGYVEPLLVEHPMASRGIVGTLYGLDTRILGFYDWPFDPEWTGVTQVAGPIVSDFVNFMQWRLAPPGYEREVAKHKFLTNLSPLYRRIYESFIEEPTLPGYLMTQKGTPLIEMDTHERIFNAIGFRPLKSIVARQAYGMLYEKQRRLNSIKAWAVDRLTEAIQKGDMEQARKVVDEYIRAAEIEGGLPPITMADIKREARQKAQPLIYQIYKRLERLTPSYVERIPEEYLPKGIREEELGR